MYSRIKDNSLSYSSFTKLAKRENPHAWMRCCFRRQESVILLEGQPIFQRECIALFITKKKPLLGIGILILVTELTQGLAWSLALSMAVSILFSLAYKKIIDPLEKKIHACNQETILAFSSTLKPRFGSEIAQTLYTNLLKDRYRHKKPLTRYIIQEVTERTQGEATTRPILAMPMNCLSIILDYLNSIEVNYFLAKDLAPTGELIADGSLTNAIVRAWINRGYLSPATNLLKLDLTFSSINHTGFRLIASSGCLYGLKTLIVSHLKLSTEGAQILGEALQLMPRLTDLDFSGNWCGNSGMKAIAEGLYHTTQLRHLKLNDNRIETEGAKDLSIILKHLPYLKTLEFENLIFPKGLKALASELRHIRNLTYLNFSGTKMEANGSQVLATYLIHLKDLTHLNLKAGLIRDAGLKHLAKALEHLHALKILNLAMNGITDDGIEALAKALEYASDPMAHSDIKNSTHTGAPMGLHELNLQCNSITLKSKKALKKVLEQMPNLVLHTGEPKRT